MDLWPLTKGPDLPQEAVCLALDLEAKGFHFVVLGGVLRVRGDATTPVLGEDERTAIAKWKTHLIELIDYCGRRG